MHTVVSSEMRAAVGAILERRISFPVSPSDIRRWALAIHWPEQPPSTYLDRDESKVLAPHEFNPFAWSVAVLERYAASQTCEANDPDRTEKQIGIDGPGLKFQLNGGSTTEYGARMQTGDEITGVCRLANYSEREGRLGHMLMTTTEDVWTNQHGVLVRHTTFTLIRY